MAGVVTGDHVTLDHVSAKRVIVYGASNVTVTTFQSLRRRHGGVRDVQSWRAKGSSTSS